MKKRFRKIGIAARLTAVVAVILAVFLVPEGVPDLSQ